MHYKKPWLSKLLQKPSSQTSTLRSVGMQKGTTTITKTTVNNFTIQNSRNLSQGYQTKPSGRRPPEQRKASAGFAMLMMSRT